MCDKRARLNQEIPKKHRVVSSRQDKDETRTCTQYLHKIITSVFYENMRVTTSPQTDTYVTEELLGHDTTASPRLTQDIQ